MPYPARAVVLPRGGRHRGATRTGDAIRGGESGGRGTERPPGRGRARSARDGEDGGRRAEIGTTPFVRFDSGRGSGRQDARRRGMTSGNEMRALAGRPGGSSSVAPRGRVPARTDRARRGGFRTPLGPAEPEAGGADRRRERRAETAQFLPCGAVTLAGRAGHRENRGAKLSHGGGGAEARVNASCNVSFARVGGGVTCRLSWAKQRYQRLHVTLVVLLLLLAELIDLLPPNPPGSERLSSLPPSPPPKPMARPLAGRPG
ncbi:hypothetical protein THAOC_31042 [Thalassiosira oceanica]|uniref:Uncharacterized protein n=1 Tax=Thalassiosira oceanica TaxID=159749 RepID=K0RCN0_THAOC|nr:hypothetical protein THAOC_31042 [Thalassiosira oceanica]|eukprot:EJK50029.1 hypothetical protein THAOC_31042 [Thalassiosira oceanica]